VACVVWLVKTPGKQVASKYDSFATCIKDSGATFYGAFWCPHCQEQKAAFGKAQKLLPYVECSNPDGKSQNLICEAAKITGYPTWDFQKSFDLTSSVTPHQCTKDDGSQACRNSYKPDLVSWLVGPVVVYTPTAPVAKGDKWTIAPGARIGGTIALEVLAETTACTLPPDA